MKPLVASSETLSNSVALDYMGSAEFEFGALPTSLRAFRSRKGDLKVRLVKGITEGESPLRVLSYFDDGQFAEYESYLSLLRYDNPRLKELSYFSVNHKSFQDSKYLPDFWWDIVNNVMWSFDKNYMNRLIDHLEASFAVMRN